TVGILTSMSESRQRFTKLWLFLNILMISWFMASCADESASEQSLPEGALGEVESIQFEMNGTPVEIELALTPAELQQGLMYRESMPENHGMLFVYSQPQYMSFWMKNTKIPLSIAFLTEEGRVSNIE